MSTNLLLLINLFELYIEDTDRFTIYYNANIASNYNSLHATMRRYLEQLDNECYANYRLSIRAAAKLDYWGIYRIIFITNFNLL